MSQESANNGRITKNEDIDLVFGVQFFSQEATIVNDIYRPQ